MSSESPPLVSVVIPAFNAEATLRRAVESVLKDRCQSSEVIVVDDGSTDETSAVARQLVEEQGSRVRYHVQRNQGANTARNAGMRLACGEFIQFLDADDELANDKLLKSIDLFRHEPTLCCVWTDMEINEDGLRKLKSANEDHMRAIVAKQPVTMTSALNTVMPLWRREHLVSHELYWDESLPCWQETEFYLRVLLSFENQNQLTHLPVAGAVFHRSEAAANMSKAYWSEKYLLGQLDAVEKMATTCLQHQILNEHILDQQRAFHRRLCIRAIVGNQPRAWRNVVKIPALRGGSWLWTLATLIPFRCHRVGYSSYRKLKSLLGR